MSDWIDNDFAVQYFMFQQNYKQVASSPMRLNCSCPVCGDSQTDKFKARFWYFWYNNSAMVHCYNCDYSAGFSRFLEEYDSDLHSKYRMEKFKDSKPSSYRPPPPPVKKVEVSKTIAQLQFSHRLDTLPVGHPILKYVEDRKIPLDAYKRLWFTNQWQELCNSVKPGTFDNPKPEYRLVIPIFNAAGKIESFQGRALKPSRIKYMTIKADENSTKVYGQDQIDDTKDFVFVLEGPIDSLFLDNALAITGGSLNLEAVPYPDKRIWVLDNENRHPDTIKRMEKLIDSGEKVCFWDAAPWQSKDINDMVVKEGAVPSEIQQYILDNSEEGLMAKLRMNKFSKFRG